MSLPALAHETIRLMAQRKMTWVLASLASTSNTMASANSINAWPSERNIQNTAAQIRFAVQHVQQILNLDATLGTTTLHALITGQF